MKLNDDDLFQVTAGTNITAFKIDPTQDVRQDDSIPSSRLDRINTQPGIETQIKIELHPDQAPTLGAGTPVSTLSGSLPGMTFVDVDKDGK